MIYYKYYLDQDELFGSVVPQHCKWDELLYCFSLEMVIQVVEWEWIFEMVVVVVVVEMNGNDNMEFGMEDIEENTVDIVDGSHKFLANLVAKIGFVVEMANVSKERVCSNYFEMDMHKLEIVN